MALEVSRACRLRRSDKGGDDRKLLKAIYGFTVYTISRRAQAAVTATAFVLLGFAAGEAHQFDWSHKVVLISGTMVTMRVAIAMS